MWALPWPLLCATDYLSSSYFTVSHDLKYFPLQESDKLIRPITEQIFSADIGGRHNVFKISQLDPPKDAIFQVSPSLYFVVTMDASSFRS